VEIFTHILASAGLSADLVPAVLDWIDPDSETRYPGGAEDREYLAMDPPRRAANRPLFDLNELAQVKGWTPEMVKRIEPFVVATPSPLLGGPINVNFAPPEVLMALMPTLEAGTAQAIAKRVKTNPFVTVDDFMSALPQAVRDDLSSRGAANDRFSVGSNYFFADVDAKFGRVNIAYRALLEREGDRLPRVVWLRRR
jgi:general secretion pathway protein K